MALDAAVQDGNFRSGDAAVVHEDGDIQIRDRLKDVIVSGGENVSSVEVEAAGVEACTVYNHMLLPCVFRSIEEDYRHLKEAAC